MRKVFVNNSAYVAGSKSMKLSADCIGKMRGVRTEDIEAVMILESTYRKFVASLTASSVEISGYWL